MNKKLIKILFTGDFCPHLRIEKMTLENNYKHIFNDFKKEFEDNDLNVVDLECPLTLETKGIEKTGPHQKAHPKTVELLKEIGIGMVAMANNHILDYGEKALLDTKDLCEENNITTIGVGKNLKEAGQPVIKEINGQKIGFLNFTESEWTIATEKRAGANPIDLIEIFNTIKNLKKKTDKIIVIAHGGNEFYHLPSPRIKKTYRYFIDAGVDAVISHHTHCLTGYEVYNNTPIFYGLGNFMYDWPNKKEDNWNYGYAVRLLIDDKINFEIIPFIQNSGEQVGVHYLNKKEEQSFNQKMKGLNAIIADDDQLKKEFQKLVEQQKDFYKLYFEPYKGKILSGLRIRKILPDLFSKRKKMLQYNVIRCESHKDIVLEMFKQEVK